MRNMDLSKTFTISDQQIEQYHALGFFIIENALDEATLQHLRAFAGNSIERMHRIMEEQGSDTLGINHKGSRYFIAHTYKEHRENYNFIFGAVMEEICRKTLGDTAKFFMDQYVIKAAERGAHFSWHQDSGYVDFDHEPYVTCWTALDDVTEENGTVYMLPYDQLGVKTRVRHLKDPKLNDMVGYFGDNPGVPVVCPAGSIAVFSSVCFHRSGSNKTNKLRRVILTQYTKDGIVNPFTGEVQQNAIPFLQDGKRVDPGFEKVSEGQ